MTSQSESTSFWIKFFTDAGVPAGDAASYAMTFSDNRIQRNMLLDLNKEYLNDMGINMMGDIIAILKHAKTVSTKDSVQEKLLRAAPFTSKPGQRPRSPIVEALNKKSTPASRTVAHYLKTDKDPDAVPMKEIEPPLLVQELASRLGPSPCSTPPRTETPTGNVFSRLGADNASPVKVSEGILNSTLTAKLEAARYESKYKQAISKTVATPTGTTVTVTGLGKISMTPTSVEKEPSVFKRLGAVKRAATSTTHDTDDEESCEYAGILQPSRVKRKKFAALPATQTVPLNKTPVLKRLGAPKTKRLSEGILATEQPSPVQKLGVKHMTSTPIAKGVLSRLGAQQNVVTSSADAKQNLIRTKKARPTGVFSRLTSSTDAKPTMIRATKTKPTGVFNRLTSDAKAKIVRTTKTKPTGVFSRLSADVAKPKMIKTTKAKSAGVFSRLGTNN